MTREQAEAVLFAEAGDVCTHREMRNFLDISIALGMLKLEEPTHGVDSTVRGPTFIAMPAHKRNRDNV